MPTYEYRCQNGHEFEVFQRMSEPPVEKCIHCGAQAERQLSAGAGLLFKGSGFYKTDNRSKSGGSTKESSKEKESSSSTSSSSSSSDSGSASSSSSSSSSSSGSGEAKSA